MLNLKFPKNPITPSHDNFYCIYDHSIREFLGPEPPKFPYSSRINEDITNINKRYIFNSQEECQVFLKEKIEKEINKEKNNLLKKIKIKTSFINRWRIVKFNINIQQINSIIFDPKK